MMYLLDTNFIINLHKRHAEEVTFFKKHQVNFADCAISVITKLEVLGFAGHSDRDNIVLSELVAKFACVELTSDIQQKTIEIRQTHKIKLPDAIILATALTKGCKLMTADKKLITKYRHYL